MSQLENIRSDIDVILSEDNELSSTVTYIKVTKEYDDDGSIKSSTTNEYDILVNIHPENTEELKVDSLGQVVFGRALIFFKYQYVVNSTTITPRIDDLIKLNDVNYRIIQLKPWIVNSSVGYYEGKLVRQDLD